MKLHQSILMAAATFTFSTAALALPKQILIVRHAEKPTVGDEGIHLSDRGRERAAALPEFFMSHPEMIDNGPAVAVYAASPKVPTGSVRAFETISPTAARLGLPVDNAFKSGEEDAIAKDIFSNPAYNNKTIIICWVRDELPLLGAALGVDGKLYWPSNVFDRVWKVNYDKDGVASLKTVQQQLLPGDQ